MHTHKIHSPTIRSNEPKVGYSIYQAASCEDSQPSDLAKVKYLSNSDKRSVGHVLYILTSSMETVIDPAFNPALCEADGTAGLKTGP